MVPNYGEQGFASFNTLQKKIIPPPLFFFKKIDPFSQSTGDQRNGLNISF
jgi:hypothetical protein